MADRCLQVIVTYSVYAVEWTEVLPLRFFRIPGGRTVSRCFVQQTGHSYTLFHSGRCIRCNYRLFCHAHTGRCCAGLPDRICQRHTLMYPRRRHGKYACHIRVPAALHGSVHRSSATYESIPGIFYYGSFHWNPGVQTRYSLRYKGLLYPSGLSLF